MVHIGIDARLYGVASGTGIGRYTEELLRVLPTIENRKSKIENLQFTVFLRRDGFEQFVPPDERWTKVLADFRPYSLAAQTQFPRVIRRAGVDCMHFTHFDHPRVYRAPFIVTIHDLILLRHPSIRASTLGPLRFWTKYAAYRRILHHAAHASVRILTPSRTVKDQAAETFGVLPEKIIPTLLGVDHHHSSSRAELKAQSRDLREARLLRSLGGFSARVADSLGRNDKIDRNDDGKNAQFLLYVGNCYPHKHVEQLIRVMPMLREQHPDLHLLIVGREDDFTRRLNTKSARTGVVFTGAVSASDHRTLMHTATAYISASADEGFDLPTIEAFAAGIPVIASDIPIHREILGDLPAYFPVGDDRILIDVIHRSIITTDRTTPAIMKRKECAKQYTWRVCAAQTLAVYREVAALQGNRTGRVVHASKNYHEQDMEGASLHAG